MATFTPLRSLLNPQFDGYKLSFSPSPHLTHVPLPLPATQSRSGTRVLGFQEVASRVRHNHLAVSQHSNTAALYVAEDGNVVLVRWEEHVENNEKQDGVTFHVVFRIPEPTHISSEPSQYPAAVHIDRGTWLVSDGRGRAYLLYTRLVRTSDEPTAQLLSSWELRSELETVPFHLHNAAVVAPHLALAVLSSSLPIATPTSSKAVAQPLFDIWAVRIPLPETSPSPLSLSDIPLAPFEVAWRLRGAHIPHTVTYAPPREAFVLIGGSPYYDVASPPTAESYEPAPEELAPIPRAGERLDTRPPPYSWTQTDDAVTLAFALPGMTSTANIHATFETQTLSLRVGAPALPSPRYSAAPLWDTIHPASSLWTWERGSPETAGLLTMHLDKAHPDTRWSHVFGQGFEADVPESLDPSELAGIRENLEKYTAALQDGGGLGQGVPSLAEGERDNEIDATVGNPVVLTWVSNDGSASAPEDDTPAVLLSQPLPGAGDPLSLVIKNDIDGLLYTLDGNNGWKHVATYPALAFVLASKRDTRFTFHISSVATLAFESGARDGGGNVYVYRGSASGDKSAKQSVFQLHAGAGAPLGVGVVTSETSHPILLCLSERALTICREIF